MSPHGSPPHDADTVGWGEFEAAEPLLAGAVRSRFEAHPHHVLATLRADGRPRVTGTNVMFHEGMLWIGSMPGSRKGADLARDPRCALHSAPLDEDLGADSGDAKIDAVARQLDGTTAQTLIREEFGDDATMEGEMWELELRSVSLVEVSGEQLRIRSWTAAGGVREVFRD